MSGFQEQVICSVCGRRFRILDWNEKGVKPMKHTNGEVLCRGSRMFISRCNVVICWKTNGKWTPNKPQEEAWHANQD